MSQRPTSQADSVLTQYPSLKLRCESRSANGVSMEDSIADAVNGALVCGGEDAAAMVKHLALAFLYARALRQKGRPEISVDKV